MKVPALFVAGEFDEAVPSSTKRFSQLVPGAEFVLIPGSGHLTQNDNLDALLASMRGFFEGRSTAAVIVLVSWFPSPSLVDALSHPSPTSLLEATLARMLPRDAVWERDRTGRLERVTVTALRPAGERVLAVELRPDADYQVAFWYASDLPGPAEALFPVTPENEAEVAAAVGDLVRGVLDERVVLAFRRGWLRGGREFLTVDQLAAMDRDRLSAVFSWRGTFDWQAPA